MIENEFKQMLMRIERWFERSQEDEFSEYAALTAEIAVTKEPVAWKDRLKLTYHPIHEGERWGEPWDSAWIHLTGTVPKAWKGQHICYKFDLGGEGLCFDKKGCPFFAVTDSTAYGYYQKMVYRFPDVAKGGEKIDLWIELAANSLFGIRRNEEPHLRDPNPNGFFDASCRIMRLARFNMELWHLRMEINQAIDLVKCLDWNHYRAQMILRILNDSADVYANDPGNAAKARKILSQVFKFRALDSAPHVTAAGHAHLDVGWLWPVRESIRKAARTCANQLDNMDRYPDYVYTMSQPQTYLFVKENYPELWNKIKQRVKEGRWEPVGGMWVEADCNLTSGESLVRQFLYGKNFFMDEFGIDVKNLWIPDVFGYPASLPQFILKSGCDKFVTQKISWNLINRFPYNTFYWKGIDGSRVFTHFPPEDSYNSICTAARMIYGMNNNSEKGLVNDYISVFGIGDGAGGPADDFIERLKYASNTEGLPKYKMGRVDQTLDLMEKKYGDKISEWTGELYLEMHRGTLTSQGRTKRNNRMLEQLLPAVEFISSCLPIEDYPAEDLAAVWKKVLINQFHDILPGSSIDKVYEVTEKEHAECLAKCAAIIADAVSPYLDSDVKELTVVNTLPYDYVGALPLPDDWHGAAAINGDKVVVQQDADGSMWADAAFGADSWNSIEPVKGNASRTAVDSGLVLENDLIRYEFDKSGNLISAFDKELEMELLAEKGNVLSYYADWPNQYEAWDVDRFEFGQKLFDLKAENSPIREIGPVRSTIKFAYQSGDSSFRQTVVLNINSKRLDFVNKVDWHEDRKMLRVSFPVIMQSSEATYDIQYGFVTRPTYDNTSWERAKFETCGQKYADLTNSDGVGVALLNDCKYGYTIKGNVIDLNLLRSPKYPHWNADQGEHEFTYSLLPHLGSVQDSNVMAQAAMLNRAPIILEGALVNDAVNVPCWVEQGFCDCGHVRMEVVKKAEKSNDIIVRLVETAGRTSEATLRVNGYSSVHETNLIEWTDEGKLPIADGKVSLVLSPFEIVTLKLSK